MVMRYGMCDAMGPMVYGENEGEVFLGRSITRTVNMSEATMQKVDAEIRKIIDGQYAVARRLLEDNRDKVEAMAKALLELETIDADQIDDIMAGRPPRPPKPVVTPPAGPAVERSGHERRVGALGEAGVSRRRRVRSDGVTRARRAFFAGVEQAAAMGRPSASAGTARHDVALCLRLRCPAMRCATRLDLSRPHVMGIVNVTPDSFSDGGRFFDPRARARSCAAHVADGADIIDIGGESTRPGAAPVREAEELDARAAGRRGARGAKARWCRSTR